MEKEFLSADEAAEMLNLHARTIRRLLASGELPGTRLGRQWRVSATAVRKLIESGSKPKTTVSKDGPAPDKNVPTDET
jgi:excisionase family DNA binding protein